MGRKRIQDENDKIHVYIKVINNQKLAGLKRSMEQKVQMADYYRKSGYSMEKLIEKYPMQNDVNNILYDDLTYDVYVPYSAYEKAFDTCVGIGAIKLEGEEILDEEVEYTENDGETLDEQFEKMTGAKRTTVRVVSALLLLLIVAGVVFGTDAIMNFIKEFFG